MTSREQRQQSAALKFRIRSARERMTRALVAMDYETALACQVEIDDLERETQLLERQHEIVHLRRAELRPVKPVAFVGVRRV